jgi:hypothetical protein
MTVIVRKPAINIREELSSLKKPTGTFGEQVMRTATADEFYGVVGTNRNLLINGEHTITQRGNFTSATSYSDGVYYTDRWKSYLNSVSGTVTHKLNQALPDGSISNSIRYEATSATSVGYLGAQQILEVELTLGRTYTISAWVKSNDRNMNLYANSGSKRVFHSGSGAWEKLSGTFQHNGSNSFGIINFVGNSGVPISTGTFVEFTQVQLELGSVATPFEHRLIQQELALCQRYFYRLTPPTENTGRIGSGGWTNDLGGYVGVNLPVPMRAVPTLSAANNPGRILREGIAWYPVASVSLSIEATNTFALVQLGVGSSSGAAQGDVMWWGAGGGTYDVSFIAEL